jgi:hypothetical protein
MDKRFIGMFRYDNIIGIIGIKSFVGFTKFGIVRR